MDLREKKTKRSLKNAFIQLRSQKPLEHISVKELAELAEVSKATFYLHYHDIYELSDCLQEEVIQNVLGSISKPELLLSDTAQFTENIAQAFYAQESLIDILFSGTQSAVLPLRIEKELKDYIFSLFPEARDDARFNLLLSYEILGAFYAYHEHVKKYGIERTLEILSEIAQRLPPLSAWQK